MSLLSDSQALLAQGQPQPQTQDTGDNSFSQGLRSGVTALGGNLRGLAAGIGEAAGASDFAREQYAKAAEAEQLAAQQAPTINSYKQVLDAPDLSTGLRRAGSYIAGLAGQSLPMLAGAGLAGGAVAATGGGAVPAFLAGTAAMAVPETGAALQAQQHDQATLADNDAGKRLATAAAEGLGKGALMTAVPGMMAGRLMGNGLRAGESIGSAVTHNLAEGIGGNAAAGGLASEFGHQMQGQLNPNRDTSNDMAENVEGAVGGAALGVPFAGAGIAGHVVRSPGFAVGKLVDKAGAALSSAKDTVSDKIGLVKEKAGEAADAVQGSDAFAKMTETADTVAKYAKDKSDTAIDKIKEAAPEYAEQATAALEFMKQQAITRTAKTVAWAKELMADSTVPEQVKAKLQAVLADPKAEASQAYTALTKFMVDKGPDWSKLGEKAASVKNKALDFLKGSNKDPLDATAEKLAAGAHPDDLAAGLAHADAAATGREATTADLVNQRGVVAKSVESMADALRKDPNTLMKNRKALSELSGYSDTPENALAVAKLYASDKAERGIDALMGHVNSLKDKYLPSSKAKSEYSEGLRSAITNTVIPFLKEYRPALLENPEAMNKLADTLRNVMTLASEGKIDDMTINHLRDVFEGHASEILDAVHRAATPNDIKAIKQLNEIAEIEKISGDRADLIAKNIDPDVAERLDLNYRDFQNIGDQIVAFNDHVANNMKGEQQHVIDHYRRQFDRYMAERFGDKAKKVEAAVMKDHLKRQELKASDMESRGLTNDAIEQEAHDPDGYVQIRKAEDVLEQPQYFGTGNAKDPDLILNKDAHRALYNNESPAERLSAQAKSRGENTGFISAQELGQEHPAVQRMQQKLAEKRKADQARFEAQQDKDFESRVDALHRDLIEKTERRVGTGKALTEEKIASLRAEAEAMAEGMMPRQKFKPSADHDIDNYGFVVAEGLKQETGLTPAEFARMRAESTTERKSKSRIDTAKGAVDAFKVVREMFGKKDEDGNASSRLDNREGESDMQRLARAFSEGMAAVAQYTGTKDMKIPDETVVARRGGKDVTAGELKKVGFRERDPSWMDGMTDEKINETLRRKEFVADMTDNELAKTEMALAKQMDDRVSAFVEMAKAHRMKYDSKSIKEFIDSEVNTKLREGQELVNKEKYKREQQKRNAADAAETGITDVDHHKNIHEVAGVGEAYTGKGAPKPLNSAERAVSRKVGLDDNALRYERGDGLVTDDGRLTEDGISALASKMQKMTQDRRLLVRNVGEKGQALLKKVEAMTPRDQAMFGLAIKEPKNSEVAGTVNGLWKKYKDAPDGKFKLDPFDSIWGDSSKKIDATSGAYAAGRYAGLDMAVRKDGVLVLRSEEGAPAQLLRSLAFTDKDRNIVLNKEAIEREVKNGYPYTLNGPKAEVAAQAGLTLDVLKSRFPTPEKFAALLVEHERSHIRNKDHAVYPRTAEGKADVTHPDAVAIEVRATRDAMDALSYNLQKTGTGPAISPDVRLTIREHIEKVLGPQVKVAFKHLLHEGEYEVAKDAHGSTVDQIIRISLHSLDPMGTAFHESLHGLLQKMRDSKLSEVNAVLFKAASTAHVMKQLRELLKNHPDALKQIEGDVEERAAYMYQFSRLGLLKVGDGAKTVIERIATALRKVLGMWSNDERAIHIMDQFQSGEIQRLGGRSAVADVLLERGTNKTFEAIKSGLKPLARIAENIAGAGDAVVRDMNIPSYTKIADLILSRTTDKNTDPGFITAQGTKFRQTMNQMVDRFAAEKITDRHLDEAIEALQNEVPAASEEGRKAVEIVRNTLDGMFTYLRDAGVDVKNMGFKENYFPVVWDTDLITRHPAEFRKMLEKYKLSGEFKGDVDEVLQKLLRNNGNEFGIETYMPGMQSLKERKLDFITPEDRAPFLQKNLLATMNSYVTQATRRAEWVRRFGENGEIMTDLLREGQEKYGASADQVADMYRYIKGVDGTLGDKLAPEWRRRFGNMIVYQNVRLLPLAVFSMAVDPAGILVRGGTIKDAFRAFKRGITEIPRGFKDMPKDEWYKLSELMGTIENSSLVHTLGSSYSQGMVGDTGRKINDLFFRYNLVEQMNTSMRVAAMPAALGFMAKHADGTHSVHSTRWLAELGLKPNELIVENGQPLLTADQFMAHGFSPEEAAAQATKMAHAVNKWVDGAILRPNAAHKPVWMNDPHFALFAHLKQFVYSFNETILKRVLNETRHGNYTPAYALAAYVPIMIVADALKGAIISGGGVPSFKKDWDVEDYIGNGMQRAGLFGVGQFGLDAYHDFQHGGVGAGVLGPAIEQLADGVKTLGGREAFDKFALDSLPANILVKSALGSNEKADPIFAE